MRKILAMILFSAILTTPASAQELFTEIQAQITKDGSPYTFRVLGDKESGAFSAYGIHVIAPDGTQHMLDQFDAFLPAGSEADVLYIEDIDFDGYADLRILKYLPGGANVPYLFWLYKPDQRKYVEAKAYEVVVSPEVDSHSKTLISRQRSSAAEYTTEFYKSQGGKPILVKREERTYSPDGSSIVKTFKITNGSTATLIDTKNLGPEN